MERAVDGVVGALIAASTDLSFNLYGYLSVMVNNFLTALYLVMVKKSPAYQGLSSTGLLFYMATLSILPLTAALLLTREPWQLRYYPGFLSRGFRVRSCLLTLMTQSLPSESIEFKSLQSFCKFDSFLSHHYHFYRMFVRIPKMPLK